MATLSNNDIAQAIYQVTKDKTGTELQNINEKIIRFLVRRRLLSKTKDILEKLTKITNHKEEKIVAKITSAIKINEGIKKELTEYIKKRYEVKEVVLQERVEEKLIGGIRIEIDDEVIDFTVKNKIKKLQEYLTRKI